MMTPLTNSLGKPLYWLRYTAEPKTVINARAISNTTGAPNPGPGLEYLPILQEEIVPDYDPRFTILSTAEAPNAEGTEVHIKYAVTDRPAADVKAHIDNAKRLELQEHFPVPDQMEALVVTVAALARQSKGLQLTPQEQAAVEALVNTSAKISQNKAIAADLKAQVDQGNKPDIDRAWVARP